MGATSHVKAGYCRDATVTWAWRTGNPSLLEAMVQPQSPADHAGLLTRDILLAVDGAQITGADDLVRLLVADAAVAIECVERRILNVFPKVDPDSVGPASATRTMFGRSLSRIDANGDPPMPRDSVLFLGAGQSRFISLRLITGSELRCSNSGMPGRGKI